MKIFKYRLLPELTLRRGSILLAVTLLAWPVWGLAVVCTPDDITLSSQSDVDAFQTNHGPGCDRVVGDLDISGADIANFDGLAGLTSIWRITILSNPVLTDTNGLSSVTTTTGAIAILDNAVLANVDGFSGVTDISGGALSIGSNPSLSDISGFSNLTNIATSLQISNTLLTNLDALSGLTSFGGLATHPSLNITFNSALQDISGLAAALAGFDGGMRFETNPSWRILTAFREWRPACGGLSSGTTTPWKIWTNWLV